ncbi:MAG: BrnT family toxin [Hyphomicrobiales bacterium]
MFLVDWDEGNLDKCQTHGLSIADVEHVLLSSRRYLGFDPKHSQAEARSIVIGQTAANRFAFVAVTFRELGGVLHIRPVSARYMHRKEIKRYEQALSALDDR